MASQCQVAGPVGHCLPLGRLSLWQTQGRKEGKGKGRSIDLVCYCCSLLCVVYARAVATQNDS